MTSSLMATGIECPNLSFGFGEANREPVVIEDGVPILHEFVTNDGQVTSAIGTYATFYVRDTELRPRIPIRTSDTAYTVVGAPVR